MENGDRRMENGKKGISNIIATVILSVVEGFRVIVKELQVFDSAQTDNLYLLRSLLPALCTPVLRTSVHPQKRNDLC